MLVSIGRRSIVGLALVIGLLAGASFGPPQERVAAAESATWDGGVSLYRSGTFTTQRSWLWCTAAGVQIVRNIVERKKDHSTSGQRRYFEWMRDRNRYDLPVSAGVDPAGWTAGLRHFVDDRYRLVASKTFDEALASAVTRLRLTDLPVALTVSHGNHGWILTGFRATADPAVTSSFKVTSVRVTGPLYGLQSKNGYDMAPNTKLTTAQLKRFFTPWKYAPKRMVWDGRYVSIQPVPSAAKAEVAVDPPAPAAPPAAGSAAPIPADDAVAIETPQPTPAAVDRQVAVASIAPGPRDSAGAGGPVVRSVTPGVDAVALGAVAVLLAGVLIAALAIGRRRLRSG